MTQHQLFYQLEWELYEKVEFDGPNRLILVNPDVTELDIRVDVYSAFIRWISRRQNDRYYKPMRMTGLDTIPGGQTGDVYFLINNWRIVIDPSKVKITGVLYSDDFNTPYYQVINGGLSPVYPAVVSALVNTVTNQVPALSEADSAQLQSIPTNPVLSNDARLNNLDAAVSTSGGLTAEQVTMLTELYRLMGLDPTKPLVVDDGNNRRTAGAEIDQTVVTEGDVTTVTRQ